MHDVLMRTEDKRVTSWTGYVVKGRELPVKSFQGQESWGFDNEAVDLTETCMRREVQDGEESKLQDNEASSCLAVSMAPSPNKDILVLRSWPYKLIRPPARSHEVISLSTLNESPYLLSTYIGEG